MLLKWRSRVPGGDSAHFVRECNRSVVRRRIEHFKTYEDRFGKLVDGSSTDEKRLRNILELSWHYLSCETRSLVFLNFILLQTTAPRPYFYLIIECLIFYTFSEPWLGSGWQAGTAWLQTQGKYIRFTTCTTSWATGRQNQSAVSIVSNQVYRIFDETLFQNKFISENSHLFWILRRPEFS